MRGCRRVIALLYVARRVGHLGREKVMPSTDDALVVVRLRQLRLQVGDQRVVFVKVGRAAARDVSQLADADTDAQEKTAGRKDTHLNCNPPAPSSSARQSSSDTRSSTSLRLYPPCRPRCYVFLSLVVLFLLTVLLT